MTDLTAFCPSASKEHGAGDRKAVCGRRCGTADIDGSESTLGILGRVDSRGASAVPHLPSSLQVMIAQAKNSLKHLLPTLLGFKTKDFYCNCFLPSAAAVRLETIVKICRVVKPERSL